MTKDPKSATLLAARLARAYPSLSTYSAAAFAEELCAIERAQRRHAERYCSGADGGYVNWRRSVDDEGRLVTTQIHDPDAEAKAGIKIYERCRRWRESLKAKAWLEGVPLHILPPDYDPVFDLRTDPRYAVLKVRLPGETEAVAV